MMDEFIAANRRNYVAYRAGLQDVPGVQLFAYSEAERCNYQYIIVEVDEATAGITRDDLVSILQAENVLAQRYFYPGCHQMEPYRSSFPHAGLLLPETERLTRRVMSLLTGTAVGPREVETICGLIHICVENGSAIRACLVQHSLEGPL
jgi:dTDP-4-amino-4,6-dideoxygalactose transaminase